MEPTFQLLTFEPVLREKSDKYRKKNARFATKSKTARRLRNNKLGECGSRWGNEAMVQK
jgi:hypothetical protein